MSLGMMVADTRDRQSKAMEKRWGGTFGWEVDDPNQRSAYPLQAQHSRNGNKSGGNREEQADEGGPDQAAAQSTASCKAEPAMQRLCKGRTPPCT